MTTDKAIKELKIEAKQRKKSEPKFAELLVFAADMLETYSSLAVAMMKEADKPSV